MKGRARILIAAMAALFSCAAAADEAAPALKGHVTLSRHHTTNVLDSPLARADWYTLLRGALEETVTHDHGATRFMAHVDLRRHDLYAIEDDAALALAAETTLRVSETLELRGTLSLRLVEEGDEMAVADTFIGIRTRRVVPAVQLQAGWKLSPDTTLVVEAAAARDMPGLTRFEAGLLPDTRLEPVRERLRLAATLTRSAGALSYGMMAGTGFTRAHAVGDLPRLDIHDHTVKALAQLTLPEGPTLAAAAGLQMLALPAASFREIRPTWEIAAQVPLAGRLSLRGSFKGAYDMASNDDPVAVWMRRLEFVAGYRLHPALTVGAGVFSQRRDFLGVGTAEKSRGAYGEAVWQAHEKLALTLRLDATRTTLLPFGIERRGLDAHLAVKTEL
ncbi:MAG TPA: hypothetical protein PL183_09820 [Aquamicrobium sp.]|nr:hypothetical protein [Aquamicrobium sp.]